MSFWQDKKVVVTGGAGFIGSYLVSKLLELGAFVIVIDNLSKGTIERIRPYIRNPRFRFIKCDLSDKVDLGSLLKDTDVCFHLAAKVGGIRYFHEYPATILRDNALMTLNLWEAARKSNVNIKMVYISSSMVFERTTIFPTPEEAIKYTPPPMSTYGFSKLFGEYVAKAYYEEFGIPYLIVRPFNVYGPGEEPGECTGIAHVIPDLIKKILGGQYPLEILGSGEQSRSFTYITDAIEGILLASERAVNDDFNIGSGEEIKIIDLARMLWKLCNRREKFKVKSIPSFKYDVKRRVPDISKITRLGWRPKVKLEEGLREVVKWYRLKYISKS